MIRTLENAILRFFPGQHQAVKAWYNRVKKRVHPRLSQAELMDLLTGPLGIQPGEVVFFHTSMRSLYLGFDKREILGMLREAVGEAGTLVFPCWPFNIRAEEYLRAHEVALDVRNTPSAMGKLSDVVRKLPGSARSLHPTNSVVALGPHAEILTAGHEAGLYPCGEQSPFYKLIAHDARIVGLGVTVDNLTFVHTVEDTNPDVFPVKTRLDEVFTTQVIDHAGETRTVETLVASPAASRRDVSAFFQAEVPPSVCTSLTVKGMPFFTTKAPALYDQLKTLALAGKTIYLTD